MKKRNAAALAVAALAAVLFLSASYWEGTAVSSGYGEFPAAGLYGACSSFPRNSIVDVTNLENGKTVRVIITQGVDNPGVFMSLSPEAASALGIPLGMVARIRASVPQNPVDSLVRTDTPGLSPDPDLNPEALVSRERAKTGATPPPSPAALAVQPSPAAIAFAPSPEPTSAPLPSPASALALAPSPVATPRPPVPSPAAVAVAPQAEEALRLSPARGAGSAPAVARLPLPVEEMAPVAVEAKSGTGEQPRLDASGGLAGAPTPSPSPAAPVVEARVALSPGAKGSSPFALADPEVSSLPAVAKAPSEGATVYEYSRLQGAAEAAPGSVSLAEPGLAAKEKPEIASGRLASPGGAGASLASAKALPDAVLPSRAEAAGEAAVSGTGPEADERLAAAKSPQGALSSSLARPELTGEAAETGVADERLTAEKKAPAVAVSLADPQLLLEAGEKAIVDERLAAARKSAGMETALVDPQLQEESAEVEPKLAAAKLPPQGLATAMPDPETTEVAMVEAEAKGPEAIGMDRTSPLSAEKVSLALVEPVLPKADAYDQRMIAGAQPALGQVALSAPAVEAEQPSGHELLAPVTATAGTAVAPTGAAVAPAEKAEVIAKPGIAGVAKVDKLAAGSYYVQIGVYRNGEVAAQAASKLGPELPLFYQEIIALDKPMYRVFVGPLRKDESGLVLYQLKAKGYRDAFIRPGI